MSLKPQTQEAAEVETKDLPDTDKTMADEVAKLFTASKLEERRTWREDLQELCWLKQIEMAESVIQYVACMTQSRGGDGLHPKPPTEVDLKAQRIQSERARLLTSKSNREA